MVKRIILGLIAVACAASTLFGAALFHYKAVIFKVNGESVGVCSLDKLTSALEEEALAKYRGIEGIGDYLAVETDLTPITNCNLLQYFTMHDVTINSKVTIADKEALASHIADLNKGRSDGTPCKIVLREALMLLKRVRQAQRLIWVRLPMQLS